MSFPSGFIVVDKPSGLTSFAMVSLVRRLTGIRRVGHAGTLDPLATGVLPVAVGQATRFIEYSEAEPKEYEAVVRFGVATDTYDAEGAVIAEGDASELTSQVIQQALPRFVGEIEQVPPAYSAIKLAGKPLYRYAREGTPVEAAPRLVRIDAIELRAYAPPECMLVVQCRKGTYIRSLAHDLGQLLGSGAHLAALRRTRSSAFTLADARPPDDLVALAADQRLEAALLAIDRVVERTPAMLFGHAHERDMIAGRDVVLATSGDHTRSRGYSVDGQFLGLLRNLGDGRWHPEKVVAEG